MSRDCNKCEEPILDGNAIDCDGKFIRQGCVILDKNTYLEIQEGDRLTDLIEEIVRRFKALSLALGKRVDYYTLYEEGNFYINDADAGANGIQLGKPYIDVNGFLRVRIS